MGFGHLGVCVFASSSSSSPLLSLPWWVAGVCEFCFGVIYVVNIYNIYIYLLDVIYKVDIYNS